MSGTDDKRGGADDAARDDKAVRRASALRANLHKRKARARAIDAAVPESGTNTGDDTGDDGLKR